MKKRIITIGCLMLSGLAFSQVGIGTNAPHNSALLEVRAKDGDYRGVLIPRIALKDLKDVSGINKGDVAVSLLIFNTTTNEFLDQGFYYWEGTQWLKIVNEKDILDNLHKIPKNERLYVHGGKLYLEDSNKHKVEAPLSTVNILTTITADQDGNYVYTDEHGKKTILDLKSSFLQNITEIANDEKYAQGVYDNVASRAQAITSSDKSLIISGGDNAVLNPVKIELGDKGIDIDKIKPEGKNQFLTVDAQGEVNWLAFDSDVIKSLMDAGETVTILKDNNNGTFTYFSENDFNDKGEEVGAGVTFDANTLRIVANEQGLYQFFDKSSQKPIAVINVPLDVKNNIVEILEEVNVAQEVFNSVAANGKDVKGEGSISVKGGAKAALNEMTITLKDRSIDEKKLIAGKQQVDFVGIVQNDGSVKYGPITPLVQKNAKALSVDKSLMIEGDGDASRSLLDAITLRVAPEGITETHIQDNSVTADKIKAGSVDATKLSAGKGDINRVAIADASGNVTYGPLATNQLSGKGAIVGSDGISVANGAAAVLNNVTLSLTDGAISANKLSASKEDENKVLMVNSDGKVGYQPVSTTVIQDRGNLTLGESLVFKNNTTGQGAVLAATAFEIAPSGVRTNHIATDAVTSEKIVAGAVTLGKIGPGAVSVGNIAAGAVTSEKIVAGAVTLDKINTDGVEKGFILATGDEGDLTWQKLGDLNEVAAGTLSTDDIIEIKRKVGEANPGEKALLKDVTLGIADNSITIDKLKSGEIPENSLLVAGEGGEFKFIDSTELTIKNADLTLGESLVFKNSTTGQGAVLAATAFEIAPSGVKTNHIAADAVISEKILAGAVTLGKIGPGAVSVDNIAGGAVTSEKILAGAVTLGKIGPSAVSADNIAAGAVTLEKIGPSAVTSEKILAGAVTLGKIGPSAVNADNIAAGAVTSEKIGPSAVSADNIAADAVTSEKIVAGAVSADNIAADAVTSEKIVVGAVTIGKIGPGAVSVDNIAADAVTSEKIVAGAVTLGKIGPSAVSVDNIAAGAVTSEKILAGAVTLGKIGPSAVSADNIAAGAVTEAKIAEGAVSVNKIAAGTDNQSKFLMSDSQGKAIWGTPKSEEEGFVAMPKIFYLPAIYIDVKVGGGDTINVYDLYAQQFSKPQASSCGDCTLPVYKASELNFFITYYDTEVFSEVTVTAEGIMKYNSKKEAKVTGKTFFNIVLQVK